jgi:beta-lactamase class A
MSLTRRTFLATVATAPALAWASPRLPYDEDPAQRIAALETRHGGRLGVHVLDTGSGDRLTFRAHERFLLCSTFKALLAAQVLAAVDVGREKLDRRLFWSHDDLQSWSPVVEKADGTRGLSVAALCEAAVTTSDNTAANLLLAERGGPAGLTAWLRSIGDATTRLDRTEPALNHGAPGDARDTTTPAAMAETLQTLLLGDVLSEASRTKLVTWLKANTTGNTRLRAGLAGWQVGDKTGSDGRTISNDVAIAWPPRGGAPLLMSVYFAESTASAAERDAVIAEVGRIAAAWALA